MLWYDETGEVRNPGTADPGPHARARHQRRRRCVPRRLRLPYLDNPQRRWSSTSLRAARCHLQNPASRQRGRALPTSPTSTPRLGSSMRRRLPRLGRRAAPGRTTRADGAALLLVPRKADPLRSRSEAEPGRASTVVWLQDDHGDPHVRPRIPTRAINPHRSRMLSARQLAAWNPPMRCGGSPAVSSSCCCCLCSAATRTPPPTRQA